LNLGIAKWVDRYAGGLACIVLSGCRWMREAVAPRKGLITEPDSILLVKFWGIGNLVLLLPVFRALRERYPGAKLTLVTLERNRTLLTGNRDLDELVTVSDGGLLSVAWTYFRALLRVRALRPRLAVDFEQFSRASAVFVFMSGADQAVGLDTPGQGRGRLFHARVPYDDGQHASRTFLDLARAAGATATRYEPLPPVLSEGDHAVVRRFLTEAGHGEGPVFVFHAGSGDNFLGRRWAPENFARLADHLIERHGGTVVLTGGEAERELVEEIRRHSRASRKPVSAAGELDLRGLTALCARAAIVVSNDTAPVHLGSSLGRPVLGIYGPNTPRLYGPLSPGSVAFYHRTPCSPCLTNFNYKTSLCRMPVCIRSITVEEVATAADRVLEQAREGRPLAPALILARDVPGPPVGA
jgi:ADP-heptose:LPS heptosyltransferase